MDKVVRFGVLRVGPHWAVITDQGDRARYPSRREAVRAARQMAEVETGFGATVELLAQGEAPDLELGPLARQADVGQGGRPDAG